MATDSFSRIRLDASAQWRSVFGRPLQNSWRFFLAAAGLLCGFYGFREGNLLLSGDPINWVYLQSGTSVIIWLLGMVLFSLAFLPSWSRFRAARWPTVALEAGLVLVVLALALYFRLPNLETVPPDVHGDEALCGNQALELMAEASGDFPRWHMFEFGHHTKPNFTYYLTGAFMKVFGTDLYGLRLSSVLIGTGAIFFIYLIGRLQWSPWMGLLAAALAVPWHPFVHFSRDGLNNIQATFFLAASLAFFYWGIERRRFGPMVLAGIAGGLGMQTYQAAYIWPFLILGYIAHGHFRNPWFLVRHSGRLVLFLVGIVLAMGMLTAIYHEGFTRRGGEVTILNVDQIQAHTSVYETQSFAGILAGQFEETWKVFTDENPGTRDTQHRVKFAYIDPACYWLMIAGLGLSLLLFFQARWFMLFWWFFLALFLGNILTIEVPWSPRLVAIFVPIPLLCAGVFEFFRKPMARLPENIGTWILAVPVLTVLIFSYQWNGEKYFNQYVQDRPAGSWTIVARYLDNIPEEDYIYWLGSPYIYFRYDTLQFLAQDAVGMNVHNPEETIPQDIFRNMNKDVWFFVYISNQNYVPLIETYWPDIEPDIIPNDYGGPAFQVYHVPQEDLEGRIAELENRGVQAHVFTNRNWQGPPMRKRHSIISYSGGHVYHHHSPSAQFSIEWRGYVRVNEAGNYGFNFWLPQEGRARLTIDNRMVIPDDQRTGDINLEPGYHEIVARYVPTRDMGRAVLLWRQPGNTFRLLTPDHLYPPDFEPPPSSP